jgi:sulfatase maturation enzyme AslB (radical SAM superfamily)
MLMNEVKSTGCVSNLSITNYNMANKNIFCNVPWSNLHIYWDGSYGMCCSEKARIYSNEDRAKYNLSVLKIEDWFKSDAMTIARELIRGNHQLPYCVSCYHEENIGHESRRIKENFKSVIFTELAFEKSYSQSPWIEKFEGKQSVDAPIDWHVDFGNECNLTCKMCNSNASSAIAAVMRRHGNKSIKTKVSWTNDPIAWNNFLSAVDNIPLSRIHVMGGEPVLIKKYHEFIDYLISKNRLEISLSFVSNGTLVNQQLIDKLKLFKNVDLEVSVEALDRTNDYIRQGSSIKTLMNTLELLHQQQSSSLQLVLRSVPQLLNIHCYADYIKFAWEKQLIIESIPLTRPIHMSVAVLPFEYRQTLKPAFEALYKEISSHITFKSIQNGRGKGTIAQKLARECQAMIGLLDMPEPNDVELLRKSLVAHCEFWDKQNDMDIKDYIPSLYQFFIEWGYRGKS